MTVLLTIAWLPPALAGQRPWAVSRSDAGHPDFEGVWVNNSATPLERPAAFNGRARLTDGEVAELKRRAARIFATGSDFAIGDLFFQALIENPEQYKNPQALVGIEWLDDLEIESRTSLITDPPDGRLPALRPAARQRQAAAAARQNALAEAGSLSNVLRCITPGTPRVGGNAAGFNGHFQIFQSRDHVVILAEMMHQARIIPVSARPRLSDRVSQWDGDSRGRWDGDTLVVESANFSSKSNFRGAAEGLRVTERFTRTAADTLVQAITVSDPTTWERPWTAEIVLKRTTTPLFEIACHEGNRRSVEGMLNAARADEKARQK